MSSQLIINNEIIQGSQEWLDLRKTKITATDACVIMGESSWKTIIQLYEEKISQENNTFVNQYMQRGLDLEPIARDLFCLQTGIEVNPAIIIKDWTMASLDGISECGKFIVEIKCPGKKDHDLALQGKVPNHYYPQLQHQMYVADVQFAYYFSFDGADGVIIEVERDEEYIKKMMIEEKKFYECLNNNIPPEPSESDYVQRQDDLWNHSATLWKEIQEDLKKLEKKSEQVKAELIRLSEESNTKGAGISLFQVQRKGNVDYTKIPELKGIDLDKYRKATTNSWRLTCN